MSTIMDVRTVRIITPYKVETRTRTGSNETFESKSVLFKVAQQREYNSTWVENGVQKTGRKSDFWLCKATGTVAENFNKYCTVNKEDGSLASRRLLLTGHFETYEKMEEIPAFPITIEGKQYSIQAPKQKRTETIFVVENFKFLDFPEAYQTQSNGANNATATAVAVEMAEGAINAPVECDPAQCAPVTPVTPVAPAVPVQAVAPQVATAPTPVASVPVGTPVAPQVPAGFTATSEVAPY